jgi:hypothetical protein
MAEAWPTRTRSVEVVDVADLSRDAFQRRHEMTCTPLIVRGFIPEAVRAEADPEVLARDAGDAQITVLRNIPKRFLVDFDPEDRKDMTVRAYVDYLKSPERTLPCYANQQPIARFPRLAEAVTYDPIWPGLKPKYIWWSSADANIGLHFDPADSYLAQLWGRKSFYLVRHQDSGHLYPFDDDITRSKVDLRDLDLQTYPNLRNIAPYAGTMEAGDLLYIPRYTWHYLWGLSTSVSTSIFRHNEITARRFASVLRMYGGRYTAGVLKQMVTHGVLGQPYTRRAYGWPPLGLVLWRLLRGNKSPLKDEAA